MSFFFFFKKPTEYFKLLVGYWMSRNIRAQAYSRSCLNLHLGFIYVVKCGSSWGVEGCGADGQLIDHTASHLLIYSDRKSISSFFFSDPSTSPLVLLLPPRARLTLQSFPLLLWLVFTNECQDNICTVDEVLFIRIWASVQSIESDWYIYTQCLSAPCHLAWYRFSTVVVN